MAKTSETFEGEFRGCLERHTPAVVSALRGGAAALAPGEAAVAYIIQSDWRAFPVRTAVVPNDPRCEVARPVDLRPAPAGRRGEMIPAGAIDRGAYEAAGVATRPPVLALDRPGDRPTAHRLRFDASHRGPLMAFNPLVAIRFTLLLYGA